MSWQVEYLAALEARDKREKANHELYQAYARLADRTSSGPTASHGSNTPSGPPGSPRPGSAGPSAISGKERPSNSSTPIESLLSDLKRDLSEAQRSKADLQARLKSKTDELEGLKTKYQATWTRVQDLSTERAAFVTRLKDKDEEIRGKAKLLENLQDEIAALDLQLNVAEQRAQDLQKDNSDLVARWMAKMGQEADVMNEASKFS